MKAQEVITHAMKAGSITQKELATALGFKSQQAIGNIVTRNQGVKVDIFVKALEAMGYEVVVRKKTGKSGEWKVD